uniref:Uncharacterized protein n=1 Tax=Rhizophagus irregularis (strain DAOM 181602 / DAOM 197198 / MUCL 43194) TaxID=747089 RepID=U9UDY7_RHIID
MPKKYSEDIKWRIVYLWNDGYSIEKISRFLYILIQMIKEKPDMYLDEMAVEMARRTGKRVSNTTIWRYLKYCGITHKKMKVQKMNVHPVDNMGILREIKQR